MPAERLRLGEPAIGVGARVSLKSKVLSEPGFVKCLHMQSDIDARRLIQHEEFLIKRLASAEQCCISPGEINGPEQSSDRMETQTRAS